MSFDGAQCRQLLALARHSIALGLEQGRLATYPHAPLQPLLEMHRSTFVTLRIDRALRGCCGSLHAPRPLAEDLWHNAWASAFSDPRFPPLTVTEYPGIDVHICVLSELEPLAVADEAQLLRWLRPAVDGLVLQLDTTQVTFLPAVWRQLANPVDFLRELKRKAGWRGDFWSPQLRIFRYTTVDVAERD